MANPITRLGRTARTVRQDWKQIGRSTYLLVAVLVVLVGYPFLLGGSLTDRLILGFLNVAILLTAAHAATETWRSFLLVAVLLGVPSFALQVVYLVTDHELFGDLLFIVYGVFYAVIIYHVLCYVLAPGSVTADKIHGAVAAYILIGILWTTAYALLDHLQPRIVLLQ